MSYKFYAKKQDPWPGALEVGLGGLGAFAQGFVPALAQARQAKMLRERQEAEEAFARQKLNAENQNRERAFSLRAQHEQGLGDRQAAQIVAAAEQARLSRDAAATNLGAKNEFEAAQQGRAFKQADRVRYGAPALAAEKAKRVGKEALQNMANTNAGLAAGAQVPFVGGNGPTKTPYTPPGVPPVVPLTQAQPRTKQQNAPGVTEGQLLNTEHQRLVRETARMIAAAQNGGTMPSRGQLTLAAKAAMATGQYRTPADALMAMGLSEEDLRALAGQ